MANRWLNGQLYQINNIEELWDPERDACKECKECDLFLNKDSHKTCQGDYWKCREFIPKEGS